ncbi:hypothetical protein FOA52_007736 [Chlamydomonas sp. UWO 241]|nr:hypothetical protein FOA52_007736 [Chlamydomonas sp. UWO 241]
MDTHMSMILEYADGVGPADEYPIPAHDKHARAIMLICMEQAQQDTYKPRYKTAVAMWRGLRAAHTKKSQSNKSATLKELWEVKQLPREVVELYIDRATVLRERCLDVGHVVSDGDLLTYILSGLYPDYNHVKLMISHGGVNGIGLDLDLTTAILLDAEKLVPKTAGSVSYVSTSSADRRHNDRGDNQQGHYSSGPSGSTQSSSGSSGSKSSSGFYCFGCKEPGDMLRECPNKHKWNASTRQKFSLAQVVGRQVDEEVVDDYEPVTCPTFLGTADTISRGLEIKGYGTVTIVTIVDGAPVSVKLVNVHVAPTLKANLLSYKLVNKVGATLIAAPAYADFVFKGSVVMHTSVQDPHGLWAVNNLYSPGDRGIVMALTSTNVSSGNASAGELLHQSMGHVNYDSTSGSPSLPAELWGEAARAANYTRNRTHSSVTGDTPYRLFTGEDPDLSKIRVFSSPAWVYGFPKNKLEPCAIKGIFVGNEPGTPAYRIYHPKSGKITVEREVRIIEGDRAATSIPYRGLFEEEDGERCFVCHSPDSAYPSVMLLCDGCKPDGNPCGNAYHLSCLKPALDSVPEGDWFCPGCTENEDDRMPDLVNESNDDSDDDDPPQKQSLGGRLLCSSRLLPPKTTRSGKSYGGQLSGVVSFIAKNDPDPISLKEAQSREDWPLWEEAIHEEYASLVEKLTWNKARIPSGQRLLPVKWVFKRKYDERGNLERYKARLVVQGFRQIPGIDFSEVFAPVSKYTTLRCLIAFAADHDLEIHQIDVRNAFLNGRLKENIWIEQPPLFHDGDSSMGCHLLMALYGLRQAPKVWYEEILSSLTNLGFVPSVADPCLFIRPAKSRSDYVYLLLYVDDMLIIGRTSSVREVVEQVTKAYECRDLGHAKQFLGMAITRDRGSRTILLTQAELTKQLLLKFNLSECRTRDVPLSVGEILRKDSDNQLDTGQFAELVGSLLYLSNCTRPDITYAVNKLSRYMSCSTPQHMQAALGVLRYLSGTAGFGRLYGPSADGSKPVKGYGDADYVGRVDTRRSTTGFVVTYNGTAVSWKSTTQQTVSRSPTEAEYQASGAVIGEAQWMIQLFPELGIPLRPILIYSDS